MIEFRKTTHSPRYRPDAHYRKAPQTRTTVDLLVNHRRSEREWAHHTEEIHDRRVLLRRLGITVDDIREAVNQHQHCRVIVMIRLARSTLASGLRMQPDRWLWLDLPNASACRR